MKLMTYIFDTLFPALAPREQVQLATINATRRDNARGKRNHDGRFIRAGRVFGHGVARH